MNRVAVSTDILYWAAKRSGRTLDDLTERFPKLEDWTSGEVRPTLKQLEDFAKATRTPFGYFFLPEPPEEPLPIPDFRTVSGSVVARPSANLLETIYAMQRRQAWLRETLLECDAEGLELVGSARLEDDPAAIGHEMRRIVGFEDGWAAAVRTWEEAVGKLRRAIEQLGVMAVINGVVGNDSHRKLDVKEFRGFALCDAYAPLIFVNGADAKSAQMFTLAHELAHVWLGRDGVSGFEAIIPGGTKVEDFCDAAAAEFLVPSRELKAYWHEAKHQAQPLEVVAKHFKVSPVVAGRRAMDQRLVDRETFFNFYRAYTKREQEQNKASTGGNFFNNQNTRVGQRFAVQVVRAAKEGRLSFKEAYSLTGLRVGTFERYARHLGFDL